MAILGQFFWRPISSAPMDGTSMLLYTEGFSKVRIGWHFNNSWHWDGEYSGVPYGKRPTHWMPLPLALVPHPRS